MQFQRCTQLHDVDNFLVCQTKLRSTGILIEFQNAGNIVKVQFSACNGFILSLQICCGPQSVGYSAATWHLKKGFSDKWWTAACCIFHVVTLIFLYFLQKLRRAAWTYTNVRQINLILHVINLSFHLMLWYRVNNTIKQTIKQMLSTLLAVPTSTCNWINESNINLHTLMCYSLACACIFLSRF